MTTITISRENLSALRENLSDLPTQRVIEEASILIQIFANAILSRQPDPEQEIRNLSTRVVSSIAFVSNHRDTRDLILSQIAQLRPEAQTLIYTTILGQIMNPEDPTIPPEISVDIHNNLSANFSLNQKLKIIEKFVQRLSEEDRIALLTRLRPLFPNSATILVPPREAVLPSTYAKLQVCAAVASVFAVRLFSHGLTKTQAAIASISLATTLAPLIVGFNKTENAIHKTETVIKNLGIRVKNHIYNNRTYYLAVLGGVLTSATFYLTYKSLTASPKSESTPIPNPTPIDALNVAPPAKPTVKTATAATQTLPTPPLKMPTPPTPSLLIDPTDTSLSDLKIKEMLPALQQKIKEFFIGQEQKTKEALEALIETPLIQPLCLVTNKTISAIRLTSKAFHLLADSTKAARLTAQMFGNFLRQEIPLPLLPD